MPRAKKTISGTPGQKVEAFKGQTYGEGVAQKRMQEAMPAPNVQAATTVTPVATQEPTAESAVAPQRPVDMNMLRERLAGVGGQLTAPDDQPNVPFNKNLDNPLAVPGKPYINRTGQIMRDLSARTGDPLFAELAARARL